MKKFLSQPRVCCYHGLNILANFRLNVLIKKESTAFNQHLTKFRVQLNAHLTILQEKGKALMSIM